MLLLLSHGILQRHRHLFPPPILPPRNQKRKRSQMHSLIHWKSHPNPPLLSSRQNNHLRRSSHFLLPGSSEAWRERANTKP
jgi:hypothetical protein